VFPAIALTGNECAKERGTCPHAQTCPDTPTTWRACCGLWISLLFNRSVGKPSASHEHAAPVCHSLDWNNSTSSLTAPTTQSRTSSITGHTNSGSNTLILRSMHSYAVWGILISPKSPHQSPVPEGNKLLPKWGSEGWVVRNKHPSTWSSG
jgi:hypothetical protein